MRLYHTESFRKDFANLPKEIQEITNQKLVLFLSNPRHPSFQARKWRKDPKGKLWYARITQDYRFTFEIQGEVYVLRRVGKHELIE